MKRLPAVILTVIAVSQYTQAAKPKWAEFENWQQLQKFMSVDQVTQLLGNPLYVESSPGGPIWYYQQAPWIDKGKTIRPDYAVVKFRKMDRGGFTLLEWNEPDWNNMPVFEIAPPEPDPNVLAQEAARKEALRLAAEERRKERQEREAELARLREIEANKSFWEKRTDTQKAYIIGGTITAVLIIIAVFKKKKVGG